MTSIFQKPLTVGNTDNYTYTVNSRWLNGEDIASHNVIVDAKVTKNNSGVMGNVIGASFTGLSKGASNVHFEYTTSGGRSDCAKVLLIVTENCQ